MKNIILGLIFICLFVFTIDAQRIPQCKRNLQSATSYYKKANYRACIKTLNEKCFKAYFLGNSENVKKSYKLKIESLRKIDYDFEADELYKKFEAWVKSNRIDYPKTAAVIYSEISIF